MNVMRRVMMWLASGLIGTLIVLSVTGAFLGPVEARRMFSSGPLIVYWIGLTVLLLVGTFMFAPVRRSGGLAAMHVGVVAILLGGMWGSDAGQDLTGRWLGRHKVPTGLMVLASERPTDALLAMDQDSTEVIGRLPFTVNLNRFWTEYWPGTEDEVKAWNCEVSMYDDGGRELATGVIRVNRPMHFGGYHFYQMGYDPEEGAYSVVQVVSDTGLYVTFTGFALLVVGTLVRFWVVPVTRALRGKGRP